MAGFHELNDEACMHEWVSGLVRLGKVGGCGCICKCMNRDKRAIRLKKLNEYGWILYEQAQHESNLKNEYYLNKHITNQT